MAPDVHVGQNQPDGRAEAILRAVPRRQPYAPSTVRTYAYAALAAVGATAARLVLDRFIGYHHPYVTFYLAVLWSGWYGGVGPALLATALGAAGATVFVLPSFAFLGTDGNLTGLEFYFIVSLTGAVLFEAQSRAERRSAQNAAEARQRLSQLEIETAQRARAEEATQEAEELLRITYEHAPVGICQVDLDGRFLEVNPRFCAITGYRPDELRVRNLREVVHGRAAATEASEYVQLMAGRLPFYRQETEYERRDGSIVWTELTVALVRDSRGRPQCAIAVLQDVTARRRSEQRLREAQKSESIGLLAAGIAHDFNNLLTAVLGNASLALDSLPPDDANRRLLQSVVASAERAAHLTGQILAYSGGGKSQVAEVDISQVAGETAELLRPSLPKSIELRLALKSGLPALETDPSQLQQVVSHLLVNAAEAIGAENRGVMTVTTDAVEFDQHRLPPEPNIGELAAGKYLLLRVRDTGAGMDRGIVRRIFDPFFTTKFMGRGLGLAAVSGIVRAHKGAIAVSSAPGQGSQFTVLLPRR